MMTIEIPLYINSLSMLYRETKLFDLYEVLVESLCGSLRSLEANLIEQIKSQQSLKILKFYHFYPNELGHFFTCCYPDGVSDDDLNLVAKRKKIHHKFGLSLTRPYFRKANQFVAKNSSIGGPQLVNTHVGLKNQSK